MELVLISFHVNDVGVEGLTRTALAPSDELSEKHDKLKSLLNKVNAQEGFYLSTCNRTEYLFVFESAPPPDLASLFEFKARIFRDRGMILTHLLGVALSKDSVVFGESQILGQFKRAYEQGLEFGLCGAELSPLLNSIIREAKAIRTEVGLTQVHTSVATVAGAKILSKFEDRNMKVLFVGSGETNTILAKFLKKRDGSDFIWSSRGHQRAVNAAADIGGEVLNWDLITKGLLPKCDVICVATHANEILVDEVGLLNANPKMVCDLSVPSNISHVACERHSILYFGIDQLSDDLSKSQIVSKEVLAELNSKILAAVSKIESEMAIRDSRHIFSQTIQSANKVWEEELSRLLNGKLSALSEEQKQILTDWSRKLVNKVNHRQIESLKQNVR